MSITAGEGWRDCDVCPPAQVPNRFQTSCIIAYCSEFKLGYPGWYCPLIAGCNNTEQCTPCWPGSVSIYGNNCTACTDVGKVADEAHGSCTACPAGKEPEPHREYCQSCTGSRSATAVVIPIVDHLYRLSIERLCMGAEATVTALPPCLTCGSTVQLLGVRSTVRTLRGSFPTKCSVRWVCAMCNWDQAKQL